HAPCRVRPRPPGATRFPYTTLFRSDRKGWERIRQEVDQRLADLSAEEINLNVDEESLRNIREKFDKLINDYDGKEIELQAQAERSEAHTSELQSRENLVCRLLLEKK